MPEREVTIRIDGKDVAAFEGEPLLVAARRAGFDIPSLCWHRKLSPTGACRLCVVKVEGARGLVTACSTPVVAGMAVTAFDGELEATRRWLLECLLDETDLGPGEGRPDEFALLVERYGLGDRAREAAGLPRERRPLDESSPVLAFDANRCVKCFRCVKACAEVQGKNVISVIERGAESLVATGAGPWADSRCDGCGECVQLCPTGALAERPHRGELRALARAGVATGRVRTTCPYCGVGCQLELAVADGRILRADGAEGLLPNDGRLCVKGRFGYDFVASPERLTVPLVRDGGRLREASWDEALDRVAAAFRDIAARHGPDALAGYASAKCTNEENYLFQKLFRAAVGTNNIDYCTRLCHASTVTAMLATIGDAAATNSIEDFAATDCLLVVGNNMVETHPVTATWARQGRARGAALVVIDPRSTPLGSLADVVLRPRLGTDVAVFNGMTRLAIAEGWVDRDFVARRVRGGLGALAELERALDPYTPARVEEMAGVDPASLREATRLYATAPTAMIATGMGMSQQTVGTNSVLAMINLMLVAGQVGRERAGIDPPRGQNNVQGATDVGCSPLFYPGYVPAGDEVNRRRIAALWGVPFESLPAARGLTTVEIMKAAGEGRVKALYVMGENPLHTDPNLAHVREALARLDFLVVADIFMTPTAALADVVLPAASFAEKDGTFVNSDRRVQRVRRAVAPPGRAREDLAILLDLARRLGKPLGDYPDASAVWDEVAKAAPIFGGVDYARLESGGVQWPCPSPGHPGTRTLFLDRFNTPDGLAALTPVEQVPQSEPPDAEYPLVLNTGRTLNHYHSATMSRRSAPLVAFGNESYVLVHPSDAARLGLEEGARARITSRRGSLTTTVRIDEGVKAGELFMPFHFIEAPVNELTRDELDPRSKIAPFKYTAVRLERS